MSTVTAIMPNFNHAAYLPEALTSLLSQSRIPDEILIIDDGSTDNSSDIIRSFADKYSCIRFIQNPVNKGVNVCMNLGLELARGEYVHYASADDRVGPDFYEKSMALLSQYPQAGLCSTLSKLMKREGVMVGVFPSAVVTRQPKYLDRAEVLQTLRRYGLWIMGNSAIYRKDALKSVGGLRLELESFADYFSAEVMALTYGACFIPEPLVIWRRLDDGYSSTISSMTHRMFGLMDKAERLMTTTYSELYPNDYMPLWKKRWLLSILQQHQKSISKGDHALLKEIEERLPEPSPLDHLFFSSILKMGPASKILTRLYLFLEKTRFQKMDSLRRLFSCG